MKNPVAQAIIDRFFESGGYQPEAFLDYFRKAVKALTVSEMWEVMEILTDRLGENIQLLRAERVS